MGDVIPSFLGGYRYDNDAFGKIRMLIGEVQAAYAKNHQKNVSKKFTEYAVYVHERLNGTAVGRMYEHVIQHDLFGSAADTFNFTYRADPSAKRNSRGAGPALGAKVLIMCINGEADNAVIVGGIRDANGDEDAIGNADGTIADGHHLRFRFNGVQVDINKDGELLLSYLGAQKIDGTMAEGVDENAVGTVVQITKDGDFTVADKDRKNVIQIDHANGKVLVTSENEVVTTAPKIRHGSADSNEPHVLGNSTNAWIQKLIAAINTITVMTAVGPSSPPTNAPVFQELAQEFQNNLSQTAFTEK